MKNLKILIVIGVALLLGFCSCSLKEKDISDKKKYKEYIGQEYQVVGKIDLYGIRPHSKAPIEYYTIVPKAGPSGRQVGSKKEYP